MRIAFIIVNTDGSPLSWKTALLRFGGYIALLLLLGPIVGEAFMELQ